MKPSRALEVARNFSHRYEDVLIEGSEEPITVIAREHSGRIPRSIRCSHDVVLRARNITGRLKKGFLVSVGRHDPVIHFAEVNFCAKCDKVISHETL